MTEDPAADGRNPPSTMGQQTDIIEEELQRVGVRGPDAERVSKRIFSRVIAYHQGPLPPAEVFADYDRVCPGAARDILDMAKKAQAHAHEMESRALSSETRYRVLGIVTAGFVVSAMIAGAVVCAVTGHDGAAIALGAAAGLSALAGVFVRGRGLFETPPEPEAVDKPPKKPPAKRGVRRGGRNQAG